MQFHLLASLLALTGYASAVTINVSAYESNADCSGAPSFNQLIDEFTCNNAPHRSLQIFAGGDGDSNGCFLETYQDSGCQIYASRIGPLSGGNSGCIGAANPDTGKLQENFTFRLICN